MENTKFTIQLSYSLKTLKAAYRRYTGEKGKVTKEDVAIWLGGLAEADAEDYLPDNELDDSMKD